MGRFTLPAHLMAQMDRRVTRMVSSIRQMHNELVLGGVRDHASLTSGGVSTRRLRQMGHPFGRQRSQDRSTGVRGVVKGPRVLFGQEKRRNRLRKGVLMPLPINKQTGRLRRSFWRTGPIGADRRVDMGFRAPYAKYVLSPEGTQKMVARGFHSHGSGIGQLGAISKRHRARMQGALAAARRKYMSF